MSDGHWTPYPKIPSRARLGGARARAWVALEKVHGANFAVVCDGAGARPAKRRELLGESGLDDFFGVGRIWPALAVAAERCAAALRREHGADAAAPVTVFGELAGGRYPHPDVPPAPGTEPVQTGVWYAPGLHWLPFDATLCIDGGVLWVGDRALRRAAGAAGLHCAPVIARGTLAHVREQDPVFTTRVPELLGLPALPGNLAEGLVVKPAGPWWSTAAAAPDTAPGAGSASALGPGSGAGGAAAHGAGTGTRPVAKFKQPAFAEDARFDGSRPYRAPADGAAGVPGWLLGQVTALLTPARAAAAVGKLGPRTPAVEVAAEIVRDAVEEVAEAVGGLDDGVAPALERALRDGALVLARFDAADRRAPA
ncbi:RNA ligase family protein [Streptomyces sp. NBC_00239]|uniref:RNA ligase family protein n=1 Tax=Streptomyces sp. NBC_00239 TaxID=2903640 RepID=UPI002E2883CB|nr:RNA ligase family protein [Streptomyces sp. NBC_00239]